MKQSSEDMEISNELSSNFYRLSTQINLINYITDTSPSSFSLAFYKLF